MKWLDGITDSVWLLNGGQSGRRWNMRTHGVWGSNSVIPFSRAHGEAWTEPVRKQGGLASVS